MKHNFLTKETKGENIILLILSIVAIALGILIFAGVLTINTETPIVGDYPNAFAWVITIVGALGLFLSVYRITRDKREDN